MLQPRNSGYSFTYAVVSIIPRNLLSAVTGFIVRLRLPGFLSRFSVGIFAKAFSLNLDEAEFPMDRYETIEDLFTRRLKPGLRPFSASLGAPADGTFTYSAPIDKGTALQVKASPYSVQELVFGKGQAADSFAPAWAMTFYLAPHNYHRVHSPVSGTLKRVQYIPGDLWPVNEAFVHLVPQLFVKNERLVFTIALGGGGLVYAVMVGALNVGRMTTPFLSDFSTNLVGKRTPVSWDMATPVTKGTELGTFMLGSTVVLIFDRPASDRFRFVQIAKKQPIMVGHPITVL